jgi:hypothetical protein
LELTNLAVWRSAQCSSWTGHPSVPLSPGTQTLLTTHYLPSIQHDLTYSTGRHKAVALRCVLSTPPLICITGCSLGTVITRGSAPLICITGCSLGTVFTRGSASNNRFSQQRCFHRQCTWSIYRRKTPLRIQDHDSTTVPTNPARPPATGHQRSIQSS